jgi:uncharacterized protein YndB with AHSA1/START domain
MEIDHDAPVWAEREIDIAAPIEVVWDVLAGVDDWPRWFSEGTSAAIAGPVAPGTTLRMKSRGPGTITATIEAAEPPHVLGWTGRTLGISAIHVWRLERSDGGTSVRTQESMDGFPVRLLRAAMRKKLEGVLETWLRDLKIEAEHRAS